MRQQSLRTKSLLEISSERQDMNSSPVLQSLLTLNPPSIQILAALTNHIEFAFILNALASLPLDCCLPPNISSFSMSQVSSLPETHSSTWFTSPPSTESLYQFIFFLFLLEIIFNCSLLSSPIIQPIHMLRSPIPHEKFL